jgi:hypothetical protein
MFLARISRKCPLCVRNNEIVNHGQRADSIVKNMLLHSRQGSGEYRRVEVNALVEDSVNLAYHGARAEKPGFEITLERSLDPAAGEVELFPQEITRRRRRSEKAVIESVNRIPSARTIVRLMTVGSDTFSQAETITVAAMEAGVPTLVEAREIIAEFHGMIRRRAAAELSSRIGRARDSLVASFARSVTNDEAAVRAAITSPWSNGQAEGQITRVKARQTSNARLRENRSASSQTDRDRMSELHQNCVRANLDADCPA